LHVKSSLRERSAAIVNKGMEEEGGDVGINERVGWW